MQTPESRLKKTLKKYLNERGAYWAMVAEGAYAKIGDPDIIACFKGHFIAIEAKTYEGSQSDWQKIREREIKASGGIYILARSVQDVEAVLNEIESKGNRDLEESGLSASEEDFCPIGRYDASDGSQSVR